MQEVSKVSDWRRWGLNGLPACCKCRTCSQEQKGELKEARPLLLLLLSHCVSGALTSSAGAALERFHLCFVATCCTEGCVFDIYLETVDSRSAAGQLWGKSRNTCAHRGVTKGINKDGRRLCQRFMKTYRLLKANRERWVTCGTGEGTPPGQRNK